MLTKCVRSPIVTPKQLIGISKVFYALSCFPKVTEGVNASISLNGPRRVFGDHEIYHYSDINILEENIEISSAGGFYHKSTGGDSLTSMQWSVSPGCEAELADYLPTLWIVDDATSFEREVKSMDFSTESYVLEFKDEDMPEEADMGTLSENS
jgi:hypothetical protein